MIMVVYTLNERASLNITKIPLYPLSFREGERARRQDAGVKSL